MEKKIGIITITDLNNYGNRLQNYAMQEVLSQFGSVYSIKRYYGCHNKGRIFLLLARIKRNLSKIRKNTLPNVKQILSFRRFEKNIKYYIFPFNKNIQYNKMNNFFNYYVCGSDQIWNPDFFKDDMYINMAGFSPSEKKIAISPSIAIECLSNNQKYEFKKYLPQFLNLSCREEAGSKLIEELIDSKCQTLLDPTLMISKEHWNKISRKPKFHKEKKSYVLVFLLGNMSKEYKEIIDSISIRYNLEIINITDIKEKYYTIGPSEFLWMICNCSLMLTDSFHGTIFSSIYDKPVRIFKRISSHKSMNSRFENLKRVLNFKEDIFIDSNVNIETIMEIYYDKDNLLDERNKFNEYLLRSFRNNSN